MYSYWIQKHDFSSDEYNNVSLQDTLKAFRKFDWNKELSLRVEGENDKECPPGIGIFDGANSTSYSLFLHICPIDLNYVFINFHYPTKKKLLGIFPYVNSKINYVEKYPFEKVPDLIKMLFRENIEGIIQLTGSESNPDL